MAAVAAAEGAALTAHPGGAFCLPTKRERTIMSSPSIEQHSRTETNDLPDGVEGDPFGLDITLIEGTPAAETVLMCITGDGCGSSCPSACTTS